jgi:hypothetical protein
MTAKIEQLVTPAAVHGVLGLIWFQKLIKLRTFALPEKQFLKFQGNQNPSTRCIEKIIPTRREKGSAIPPDFSR